MRGAQLCQAARHRMAEGAAALAFGADQVGVVHPRPVRLGTLGPGQHGGRKIGLDRLEAFGTDQAGAQRAHHADARRQRLALDHAELLAHQLVALAAQPGNFQRLLELHAQRGDVPRLLDIAVDLPFVDRLHGRLELGIRGGQDADDMRIVLARMAQQLVAVFAGHALVRDQHGQRVAMGFEQRLALLDRTAGDHGRQPADRPLEILDRGGLVVDEQNRGRRCLVVVRFVH